MENEHVISALTRKRAEVAGEIDKLRRQEGALTDDLAALDRSLRMFNPDIDLHAIQPVSKRPKPTKPREFGRGGFTRAVFAVLRGASAPMTAREIAAALMDRNDLPTSPETVACMVDRVRGMLARQDRATLDRTESAGGLVLWSVTKAECV